MSLDLDFQTVSKPQHRPENAQFSSGPCRKHPGWNVSPQMIGHVGRSHRSPDVSERLQSVIDRMKTLLGLPADWVCGITPGSGTGACTMALQNLLGPRPVDILVSDGFSEHWSREIKTLALARVSVHQAPFGAFPQTSNINWAHDLVLTLNGTNSGVVPPGLEWIPDTRTGLVIADGVSAAFAMALDFSKIDALCWSWQKALGGEGGHGMIALSPRALERLALKGPSHVSKLVGLQTKTGDLNHRFFDGYTISTPSIFAVEDIHSALDWATAVGGLGGMIRRVDQNHDVLANWVLRTPWIDWVGADPDTRSKPSVCLKLVDFSGADDPSHLGVLANDMCALLEKEQAAFDIWSYGKAPPGFRIWAGPTVEARDLDALTRWMEWAFHACHPDARFAFNANHSQHLTHTVYG